VLTDNEFTPPLGVFDLDNCRDPKTGAVKAWAQALVDKAGAYVEVMPSGTGLRIIGCTTFESGRFHRAFKGPKYEFAGDKEGIEVYRHAVRYITVTGEQVGDCAELPNLDALIDEVVKHYGGASSTDGAALKVDWAKNNGGDFKPFDEPGIGRRLSDKKFTDRSAGCYAFIAATWDRGYTPDQIMQVFVEHDGAYAVGHYGDPLDEEKLRGDIDRIVGKLMLKAADKAAGQDDALPAAYVEKLNRNHAIVRYGSATNIALIPDNRREKIVFMKPDSFGLQMKNRFIEIKDDDGTKKIPIASAWLQSPHRREYLEPGVVFEPGAADRLGALNLWRGFAIEP
jgi:hypothetical protein